MLCPGLKVTNCDLKIRLLGSELKHEIRWETAGLRLTA